MSGTIAEALSGKGRVCIDSAPLIYFLAQNPRYLPVVRPVFQLVSGGALTALSSYITLLEVLIKPLREGRQDIIQQYKDIIAGSGSFTFYPVDSGIAERGAEIRATYDFRTPDALQLATASMQGAEAFLTNDKRLRQYRDVEVLVLDDFVQLRSAPAESEPPQ
jgi:predicted nucleic acid-binding protein